MKAFTLSKLEISDWYLIFVSPTKTQSKTNVWEQFKYYANKTKAVIKISEQDLEIHFNTNHRIKLLWADDETAIERHRWIKVYWAIFDEYATMNNYIRTGIIRPALSDTKWWADFYSCIVKDSLILWNNWLELLWNWLDYDWDWLIWYKDLNKQVYWLWWFHTATNFYWNIATKTIILKNNLWIKIEGTPNHMLWTDNGWKRLDEFKLWDTVLVQKWQNVFWNIKENLDLCYLMWLYIADWTMLFNKYNWKKYNYPSSLVISKQSEFIKNFLIKKFNGKVVDNNHTYIHNTKLLKEVQKYFSHKKAKHKSLSNNILWLNRECLIEFLRWYFDWDWCCFKNRLRVSCCSSSEILINQLQNILLILWIVCVKTYNLVKPTKRVKKESHSYILTIEWYNAKLFHKIIWFKSEKNNNYIINNSDRNNWQIINGKRIIDNQFYYSKVKSLDFWFNYTYDFVIPDTKSFYSNWYVSHNTPKGYNAFYELRKNSEWRDDFHRFILPNSVSKIIDNEEIETIKKDMNDENLFLQEYECSWSASIAWAYYSKQISEVYTQNRIRKNIYDNKLPVYTFWDLWMDDYTVIVFAQVAGLEIRIIDCHFNHWKGLEYYTKFLSEQEYRYETHYLPHDVNVRELWTWTTRLELLNQQLNYKCIACQRTSLKDWIDAVRNIFYRMRFDDERTEVLRNALSQYQQQYDRKLNKYKDEPLHDWSSHFSDAIRLLALQINNISLSYWDINNAITPNYNLDPFDSWYKYDPNMRLILPNMSDFI